MAALSDEMGGWDGLLEPARIAVRSAAMLVVSCEDLQAKIAAGAGSVSVINQLSRLENVKRRALADLKARKPKAKPANPLLAHFSKPPQ